MRRGFLAVTQFGDCIKLKAHPRKELLEHFGRKHASKMYIDLKDGSTRHTGYVIAGMWCSVYEVHDWKGGG